VPWSRFAVVAPPLLLLALTGGPACGPAATSPAARTVGGLCDRCHAAPQAGSIAAARWAAVRGVHRGRVHVQLTDDEWLGVEEYLTKAP
jgi:hypothetical protein